MSSAGDRTRLSDYKRLWLENEKELYRLKKLKEEKERLKAEADAKEAQDKRAAANLLDYHKRENELLRKKIQELEPQLNMYEKIKAENEKLKLENGALIRVANKLNSKKINKT